MSDNDQDMFCLIGWSQFTAIEKVPPDIFVALSKNLTKIQMLKKKGGDIEIFVNDRLFLKQHHKFSSYRIMCSLLILLFPISWTLILDMDLTLLPTVLLRVPHSWTSWRPCPSSCWISSCVRCIILQLKYCFWSRTNF